jgi:tetrahydromethanopterin S-methyltransferase subunit G
MLAGSDIPPPRGFVWVVAGLVAVCLGIALAIPWLWDVRRRQGLQAVLVRTAGIGLVVGLVLAAAFALFSSGEPSIPPPGVAEYAIWFSVLMSVGALNGVVVGLIVSWLRPRFAH